jgi:hypothetical protein
MFKHMSQDAKKKKEEEGEENEEEETECQDTKTPSRFVLKESFGKSNSW